MKLIIAGSRSLKLSRAFIKQLLLEDQSLVHEIVSGGAEGIDTTGEQWAKHNHCPIKRFIPDWNKHGKAAGPIRNKEMAEYADSLLLIWDGESKGSASMKSEMLKLNKPVYEVILRSYND